MRALAILLVMTAGSALAAPTHCTHGGLERSVDIVYANSYRAVPCEVTYDKPMEDGKHSLWRADNEEGYCEARAAEFVAKLQDMGWSCAQAAVEAENEAESVTEAESEMDETTTAQL